MKRLGLVAVGLVATLGCQAKPRRASRSQPGETGWHAAPQRRRERIQLIDPGAEPRQLLRYSPAPGVVRERHLVLMGFSAPEPELLASTLDVDVTGSADTLSWQIEGRGHEVLPETLATSRALRDRVLATWSRARARHAVDAQGRYVSAAYRYPETFSDEEVSFLESQGLVDVVDALPAEAIGIGARWLIEAEATQSGVTVTARGELVLAANQDGMLTIIGKAQHFIQKQSVPTRGHVMHVLEGRAVGTQVSKVPLVGARPSWSTSNWYFTRRLAWDDRPDMVIPVFVAETTSTTR